jgi:hypothetical protein
VRRARHRAAADQRLLLLVGAPGPEVVDRLADVAASLPAVLDSAVAVDRTRATLWRYREARTGRSAGWDRF